MIPQNLHNLSIIQLQYWQSETVLHLEHPSQLLQPWSSLASISVLREGQNTSEKYSHTYEIFEQRKITWDKAKIPAIEETDTALSEAAE